MADPERMRRLGRRIQINSVIGLAVAQLYAWLAFFFLINRQPGFNPSTVILFITAFVACWAVWWVIPIARGARSITIGLVAALINAFLYLVVAFAALYYHFGTPNNFLVPLTTHIDALYFVLGTPTTAGTGNIAAVSQLSRGLVSLQMAIDLIFVTVAAAIAVTRFAERRP